MEEWTNEYGLKESIDSRGKEDEIWVSFKPNCPIDRKRLEELLKDMKDINKAVGNKNLYYSPTFNERLLKLYARHQGWDEDHWQWMTFKEKKDACKYKRGEKHRYVPLEKGEPTREQLEELFKEGE